MARPMRFGYDGDGGLGERLLALALSGEKTATCSLAVEWSAEGTPPRPGERWALVDGDGAVCGSVETARVEVIPFDAIGDDVARDEGEGFADAAAWRRAHRAVWHEAAELIRAAAGDPAWRLRDDEPVV